MTAALAAFQDRFLQALWAQTDGSADAVAPWAAQPGFAVYRNTVMKGCIDALQANYPAVLRLVGEEWFRAVAALYVRMHPPQDARLLHYGYHFAAFLRDFAPAVDWPYLEGVARLDRCWTEAHMAPDAAPLAPSVMAALPPDRLGLMALRPHPAARWLWHAELPIYTLWRSNRVEAPLPEDVGLIWCGEGALLTRPGATVQWTALDAAACAFLDACAAGQSLAQACAAALACDAEADLARLMALLLDVGALCALEPPRPVIPHQETL